LERLQVVGCQRDKAGDRKLHFDQYCLLLLVATNLLDLPAWIIAWVYPGKVSNTQCVTFDLSQHSIII
jgi:hypothetical protein